jgi:hypothetical protein
MHRYTDCTECLKTNYADARLLIHFTLCSLLKHPSHILLYRYGQCLQIDGEIFPTYFHHGNST